MIGGASPGTPGAAGTNLAGGSELSTSERRWKTGSGGVRRGSTPGRAVGEFSGGPSVTTTGGNVEGRAGNVANRGPVHAGSLGGKSVASPAVPVAPA
jgi:hypothetical protein